MPTVRLATPTIVALGALLAVDMIAGPECILRQTRQSSVWDEVGRIKSVRRSPEVRRVAQGERVADTSPREKEDVGGESPPGRFKELPVQQEVRVEKAREGGEEMPRDCADEDRR